MRINVLKKKVIASFALLCSLALLVPGCRGLDDLSTEATVEDFSVEQVYTKSVDLGTPHISHDTILIPLNYGKYIKNIQLKARIQISSKAKRLLDINPDTITFQNAQTVVQFYVSSESGQSYRWFIALEDNDQHNSSADILHMDVLGVDPEKCMVADSAFIYIDGTNQYVKILAPEASFPLTITPKFLLSDSAHFAKAVNSLSFSAARTDMQTLTVKAENGAESDWITYVETGEAVYAANNDNYLNDQLYPINVDAGSLQVKLAGGVAGNELKEVVVDSVNNTITLMMRNGTNEPSFSIPIKARLTFDNRFNQVMIGYHQGEVLQFDSKSTTHKFYLFDRYNDLKKAWTVKIGHYLSPEANVTHFLPTKFSSISFDTVSTEINQEAGIVTLLVTDGTFPATIRANISVSDGATLSGITSGTDFTMQSLSSTKTFYVTAEDGTRRKWELHLQYAGTMAKDADVESFRVTSYYGKNGLLVLNPIADIDKTKHTITLHITQKGSDFPLHLKANMTTSYKSTFTSGSFSSDNELTFQNKNSTYQFTLQSQDKQTKNTYTIKFSDESPAASTDAELLTFTPKLVASGYTVQNTIVSKPTHEITIILTAKGSGSFYFTPKFTVSSGATVQGITANKVLTFGNLTDVKTFTITSEDGATQNEWTIRVSYQPQLPNWDLNSWGTGSSTGKPEPTYWCTSNVQLSSVSAQVTKGTGQDGTACAKCTGQSVLGNFAAGSVFFGTFQMDLSKLSQAKLMTNFYLKFDGKPKSITADINYTPGNSSDKMSIDFHLYNYSGSGTPSYHTMWSWGTGTNGQQIAVASATYEPNVTIVGFVREELGATNGWKTHTSVINYDGYPNLEPNYCHVAYCCSYKGDDGEGSTSSVLYVDNIRLNY